MEPYEVRFLVYLAIAFVITVALYGLRYLRRGR